MRDPAGRRATGRVSAVRIALDEPYVASKQALLVAVAATNDVRCVFHRSVDLATVVGPVGQLAHVQLLFTSLLIQVHAARTSRCELTLPERSADTPSAPRARSWRHRGRATPRKRTGRSATSSE